jgi:hypothetical protein
MVLSLEEAQKFADERKRDAAIRRIYPMALEVILELGAGTPRTYTSVPDLLKITYTRRLPYGHVEPEKSIGEISSNETYDLVIQDGDKDVFEVLGVHPDMITSEKRFIQRYNYNESWFAALRRAYHYALSHMEQRVREEREKKIVEEERLGPVRITDLADLIERFSIPPKITYPGPEPLPPLKTHHATITRSDGRVIDDEIQ